jgi:hypothetical protein
MLLSWKPSRGVFGVVSLTLNLHHSPFLRFVSDTDTFDDQIQQYISTGYAQLKYACTLAIEASSVLAVVTLKANFLRETDIRHYSAAPISTSQTRQTSTRDTQEPLFAMP